MWTLVLTHKFLTAFWKLEDVFQEWVKNDILDIKRNADIIEMCEEVEIIDEYDGTTVTPVHMVNYFIDKEEEKVYIISINSDGILQKLNNYRQKSSV